MGPYWSTENGLHPSQILLSLHCPEATVCYVLGTGTFGIVKAGALSAQPRETPYGETAWYTGTETA